MRLLKTELLDCENLLKLLKRSSFTLKGDEALAFARAYHWLQQSFESSKKEIIEQSKPKIESTPVTQKVKPIKKK